MSLADYSDLDQKSKSPRCIGRRRASWRGGKIAPAAREFRWYSMSFLCGPLIVILITLVAPSPTLLWRQPMARFRLHFPSVTTRDFMTTHTVINPNHLAYILSTTAARLRMVYKISIHVESQNSCHLRSRGRMTKAVSRNFCSHYRQPRGIASGDNH